MGLKKLCNRCNRSLIDYNKPYCSECENLVEKEKADKNKYYDENIRYSKENIKYSKFYKSKPWIILREQVLQYYNYLDVYEYYVNKKVVYANTVHHIIELKDNWSKRLDFANQFPCSLETHSLLHKLYEKDKECTQKLLRELLDRWEREFGSGG